VNLRLEILKEMDRQGVTQTALADRTGIPAPRLSEWLSGKRPRGATEQTINAVMKALGLKVVPTRKA
jgi:transcriptional regulator with XRE-family HTH domain